MKRSAKFLLLGLAALAALCLLFRRGEDDEADACRVYDEFT